MLISKLCETIVANLDSIVANELDKTTVFSCATSDKMYTLYFKFGFQVDGGLNKYDIVINKIVLQDKKIL